MKKIILLLLFVFISLLGQDDANVLSYYAADNSLDGQPRIDMVNILKFYPVFAIQDSIKTVKVNIYYGNKTHESIADKMSGGKYWQTLLPEFTLGDALQRVEVEMKFTIEKRLLNKLNRYKEEVSELFNEKKQLTSQKEEDIRNLKDPVHDIAGMENSVVVNVLNKTFTDLEKLKTKNSEDILKKIEFTINYKNLSVVPDPDSLIRKFKNLIANSDKFYSVVDLVNARNETVKALAKINKDFKEKKYEMDLYKNKLKENIFNEIAGLLTDSTFSGPAIKKSDLIISEDFESATLLYRYYKNNLRYRKALDPAESLGIFRLRYIPLPIVGRPGDNKVQLLSPMGKDIPVVFEVGLAFGDEVVSGDNTFKPAFSLSRLGVAIIITEKLFKSDANILGLALTYDFNSYASIGVGRNLAGGESYPYYSFGINKKAFEQLLIGLAGIFK